MSQCQHERLGFEVLTSSFLDNKFLWISASFRYIHRRLRFVGVKAFSHFCSLFFLALWHGLHVGYFTVFLFQFLVINAEKSVNNSFYINLFLVWSWFFVKFFQIIFLRLIFSAVCWNIIKVPLLPETSLWSDSNLDSFNYRLHIFTFISRLCDNRFQFTSVERL